MYVFTAQGHFRRQCIAGCNIRVPNDSATPLTSQHPWERVQVTQELSRVWLRHFSERRTLLSAAQALLAQGTGKAGPMAVRAVGEVLSIGPGEGTVGVTEVTWQP